MRSTRKSTNEQGFTIVELMISLTVLSVILVVATVTMIQIGALYSKGVNAANLQNASRTVVADLSGQLQFSGNVPMGCTQNPANTTCYANKLDNVHNTADGTNETIYTYCISNTRYTYVLGRELGTDSSGANTVDTQHVLWRDTLNTVASTCPVPDIVNGINLAAAPSNGDGYEMLGTHMSLTRFNIQQVSSGIYNADVWMAFGDHDLVNSDGTGHSTCNGGRGTQFCSISAITTQLTGRIY